MGDPVTINLRHVARGLGIPLGKVEAVLELLDEGNTVPFITRYRKDQTGGLDEEQIRLIQSRLAKARALAERKQTILRSIESQGKLTDKLAKQIRAANTAKRLEDLYLPYKPRKQTLATVARDRGLEPLALEILEAQPACADLDARAADFVNPDRQVPTPADALLGAGHILAEQFSEAAELRQRLRDILQRTGKLVCSRASGDSKPADKAQREPASAPAGRPSTQEGDSATSERPGESRGVEAGLGSPESTSADPQPAPDDQADAAKAEPRVEAAEAAPTGERPADRSEDAPASEARGTAAAAAESVETAPPVQPPPSGDVGDSDKPIATAPKAARKQPKEKLSKKELKKKRAEEKRQKAFSDYFDYQEEIRKIPPHRVLAMNRGERAKVLRVRLDFDVPAMHAALEEQCVPSDHPHAEFLRGCARDALARLILPSLEREVRRELTERAETHAVGVFARNLRNLLLQPPVRGRRVLAVDPGFRSGCKLAALDQFGNFLGHGVIYLVGKPDRKEEARRIVLELIERFELTVVVIGNGTACRETEDFFAALISESLRDRGVAYVIVNEAGASVYSTNQIGREEFPDYDASLRGAISIGRRLQDPLSELVKIDPANIGVGLYQHDVKAKHLENSLDEVVESCVNYVGVDANTASPALLRYVSGLNQLTARRIYEHRLQHGPFRSREQLRDVPGFGELTFVQAAGFLKITGGDHFLDVTWIHPESYEIAERVMAKLGCTPADLAGAGTAGEVARRIRAVDVPALARELGVGELLLRDILAQLARPGRDPREDLPAPVFKQGVLKLEDLTPGMELTGTVLNVVDFGAFVDIGMHDSGLVHVSQLADRFVRDPHDVVAVGDIVKVWVVDADKERRRVSLTMIPPGARHGRRRDEAVADERPTPRRPADQPQRPPRRRSTGPQRRPERKGPPGSKPPGPAKPRFKPQGRPKPVTPITKDMIAGKEPMRSFSDLAQFFQGQDPPPEKAEAGNKPSKRKRPDADCPKGQQNTAQAPPEPPDDAPAPQASGQGAASDRGPGDAPAPPSPAEAAPETPPVESESQDIPPAGATPEEEPGEGSGS